MIGRTLFLVVIGVALLALLTVNVNANGASIVTTEEQILQHTPSQWAVLVEDLHDALYERVDEAEFDSEMMELSSVTQSSNPSGAKQPSAAKKPANGKKTKAPAVGKKTSATGAASSKPKATDAEKFAEFQKKNAKKYNTPEKMQKAFQQFSSNRKEVSAANSKAASLTNPKPFTSTGPLAAMSPEKFRALLSAKPPKARTGGRGLTPKKGAANAKTNAAAKTNGAKKPPVAKQPTAAKKARFMQVEMETEVEAELDAEAEIDSEQEAEADFEAAVDDQAESEADQTAEADADILAEMEAESEAETEADKPKPRGAGRAAGASGTVAGASGTVAGASGTVAGASGTVAGASGTVAGASGTVAGASGTVAGASGTVAGASGTVAGASGTVAGASGTVAGINTVVQPRAPAKGMAAGSGESVEKVLARIAGSGTPAYNQAKAMFDKPNSIPMQANELPQQGACGSCYAQAAIGSLELQLKQARKFKAPLSVQQAIDCVRSSESSGCAGGTPMDVLDYFKTHPIALASEYPYTGTVGQCRDYTPTNGKVFSNGFKLVAPSCTSGACNAQASHEISILSQIAKRGAIPLIAYVDASKWQNYASGLFPVSYCSAHSDNGNHVVQIAGWGVESINDPSKPGAKIKVPYWKVRNSWGNSWGERGFIKLPFGVNACGIANYVGLAAPPK